MTAVRARAMAAIASAGCTWLASSKMTTSNSWSGGSSWETSSGDSAQHGFAASSTSGACRIRLAQRLQPALLVQFPIQEQILVVMLGADLGEPLGDQAADPVPGRGQVRPVGRGELGDGVGVRGAVERRQVVVAGQNQIEYGGEPGVVERVTDQARTASRPATPAAGCRSRRPGRPVRPRRSARVSRLIRATRCGAFGSKASASSRCVSASHSVVAGVLGQPSAQLGDLRLGGAPARRARVPVSMPAGGTSPVRFCHSARTAASSRSSACDWVGEQTSYAAT